MGLSDDNFDVIVVGGGHAGCEAAMACSRLGRRVALVTGNLETIGQMSCNPAIGGVGKGHLVKEIEALGGVMGRVTDATGIQFRRLNASKGPAVRATRVQSDKARYRQLMRSTVAAALGVTLLQLEIDDVLTETSHGARRVVGARATDGTVVRGPRVIITTGTFLRGRIHVGHEQSDGGRAGDPPARGLSASLERLGVTLRRLKTGTPCRIDKRTIDWLDLEAQLGDEPQPRFCEDGPLPPLPQLPCYITQTTDETHAIIRANLHLSPLYGANKVIEGTGPRYCPSIEDKVVRFADKPRHQIFLEPEGLDSVEIYPNGISTSLPADVQQALVRSIPGLERAQLVRPGYAVEYDAGDPRELSLGLEHHGTVGLHLAGQINGTSGYEEAAIQGLIAGCNAALARDGESLVFGRHEAYAGVLVDDLVTRGADEPYRMMTSRAEHRLVLREDNADERVMPRGRALGLVDDERWSMFQSRQKIVADELLRLSSTILQPNAATHDRLAAFGVAPLRKPTSLMELLRRPEVSYVAVKKAYGGVASDAIGDRVETQVKYAGYIARQDEEIARARSNETLALPSDLDFTSMAGLSNEVRERLAKARPSSIGQASRIAGVTPAAVSILMVHARARQSHARA